MSADEIIKHIPEIASVTKVAIGAVPFTAIVKRMLGPAADELAEMWRDHVRLYRYERQLKCMEKAEGMAIEAGYTPQAVPLKILFPLLEGASFEENEDLHTMWAALLANASDPRRDEAFVHPSYIDILKQLSTRDAQFLAAIYDPIVLSSVDWEQLETLHASLTKMLSSEGLQEAFYMAVDNILRLRMLAVHHVSGLAGGNNFINKTKFGGGFVRAVSPPKPKS
jgi:hypothetical protein